MGKRRRRMGKRRVRRRRRRTRWGRGGAGEVCFGNRSRGGFCPHWSLVIGAHWCNTTHWWKHCSTHLQSALHRPWWKHGTMVNPSAHSNWIHGVRIRWDGWVDLSGSNRTTPPYPHSQFSKVITALLINHLSAVHCFWQLDQNIFTSLIVNGDRVGVSVKDSTQCMWGPYIVGPGQNSTRFRSS